jgi:23S rRNA (uridine2552-2'-O)-methyltransferase
LVIILAKSKSSKGWLKEHFDDPYVKKSREQGFRSRAVYKLLEIQQRDHLLKPGLTVVDLGAAPGSWSEAAAELVEPGGKVIASDILPMDALAGVQFIQGDFTETAVCQQILAVIGDSGADLVISDMAPNLSGMKDIDQPRMLYLAELALDLARTALKPGGGLLVKVFQGAGLAEYKQELQSSFRSVKVRKPKASRARSAELYLLAEGFIAGQ